MSLFNVFDVAGSGMNAQSLRLNLTASNPANAETVAATPEEAYKARQPIFAATLQAIRGGAQAVPVQILGVAESNAPAQALHMPQHPMADAQGYVYRSNVNTVEEMVNMMSASRSYQNNVEVMNTSKELLLQTLRLGT
jgi:flagellar basal-body rod protein FlgC